MELFNNNSKSISNNIKYDKIGLCGFKNMGNTCYMNSTLQILIHSRTFISFFLSQTNPFENNKKNEEFVDLVIKNKIKAPFIKSLVTCSIEKMEFLKKKKYELSPDVEIEISYEDLKLFVENTLTLKFAVLINKLVYLGISDITPTGIKKIIDRKIPSLRGFSQEDSHELLIGIFDILIEETCVDSEPKINNVPEIIKEYLELINDLKIKISKTNDINEKKQIIDDFNKYKSQHENIICKYDGLKYMKNVFGYKRKSSLDTFTTGYNQLIFNLLIFDINTFKCMECGNTINKYEFNTILSLDVKSTLKECFEEYVKDELIERKCEICSNTKTIKKKQIWRPGTILYIHLCRFNNLPNGRTWKNNQEIEIPYTLDLTEYCDNSMKTNKSLTYKYKLKGSTNHMGSLNGGHYTADGISIIDNKTWYHFDDSRVGRHQKIPIDTTSAYILMYEMDTDNVSDTDENEN